MHNYQRQSCQETIEFLSNKSLNLNYSEAFYLKEYLIKNNNLAFILSHIQNDQHRIYLTQTLTSIYKCNFKFNPFSLNLKIANIVSPTGSYNQLDDQYLVQKISYVALKIKEDQDLNIYLDSTYSFKHVHLTNLIRLAYAIKLSSQFTHIPISLWTISARFIVDTDQHYDNYRYVNTYDLQNIVEHIFKNMFCCNQKFDLQIL